MWKGVGKGREGGREGGREREGRKRWLFHGEHVGVIMIVVIVR